MKTDYQETPPVVSGNKINLSRQVAQGLKQQIRKGVYKPGDFLPPFRTLGAEFEVSLNVIYRAIRELEQDGIVTTQHGKGVQICGTRRAEQAAILFGFIQPYPADVGFEQHVFQYAGHSFSERNNFVIVQSAQASAVRERQIAEHLVNNGIQGIILWPVENSPNGRFFEQLARKVPVVLVDRLLADCRLPGVVFDTSGFGRELCQETFVNLEKRRLLVLLDSLDISPYRELEQGLCETAETMGRGRDLVIAHMAISTLIKQMNRCDFSQVDTMAAQIETLLRENDCDTVFCMQDEILDNVIVQTGLYDRLPGLQLLTTATAINVRTRRYNESNVMKWFFDFPLMISTATEMLQHIVLSRKSTEEIVRQKVSRRNN